MVGAADVCDIDVVIPAMIDASPHTGGRPQRIAFAGDQALLDPTPDAAHPITLAYVARIPALSDANPTNWVLQQAPQMYLYASLLEAEPFLANDARGAVGHGLPGRARWPARSALDGQSEAAARACAGRWRPLRHRDG